VASGFDEWVTARTPSLLRFAQVLAGSDDTAQSAVRSALARVWASWETTRRADDPDLRARQLVVRACPSRRPAGVPDRMPVAVGGGAVTGDLDGRPIAAWLATLPLRRRAVVVLTFLEDRPDDEIADVLGLSEASVRAHRQRALAALPAGVPVAPDARDAAVRTTLEALATPATTHLVDLPAGVDPPPARHRRGVWLAVLAVLGLIVGVAWIKHESRTPSGVITYPKVSVPTTWRVESYGGVQVRVPSTWGWGGAPIHADYFGGNRLGACGSNQAAVGSDTSRSSYVTSATSFVGRPAVLTYRCVPWGSDGVMPSTDAVWFGSPMRVGFKGLGAVVAETRAIGDQHLTVFSADSRLRREVLGSAEVVDTDANGCPTRAVQEPIGGPAGLEPSSLSVCVYSQDTGVPLLLWSGREDAEAARRYVAAVGRASAADGARACARIPQGQWVALGVAGSGGERWDVVNLGCGRIVRPDGAAAPLEPETLDPWAHNAIRAYVAAPRHAAADLASYFRSPTG
jgi:DNA-directed RNA polymerase specialized sigma24 family protein